MIVFFWLNLKVLLEYFPKFTHRRLQISKEILFSLVHRILKGMKLTPKTHLKDISFVMRLSGLPKFIQLNSNTNNYISNNCKDVGETCHFV